MKFILVIGFVSWLIFANNAEDFNEEFDEALDEADLRLFEEDMDSEGMEYENSAFELEDITSSGLQPLNRAEILKSEIIGKQLKCGRKIKGEKFAKTTKFSPIHFKTPKLSKKKYPNKVNCKSILEVPKGTKLYVNFYFMDVDTKRMKKDEKKCKDFLRIKGPGGAKFYCGQWDQPGKVREMGPWGKDKTIQLSFKSNNDKYRNKGALVYLYAETIEDVDCQFGDGIGSGGELQLEGSYTIEECIDAVKEQYPEANGVTINNPCPKKCECHAEFDMTDRQSWQACKFKGDDVKCKAGDGIGGEELRLLGSKSRYTIQECIDEVKERHPTANGATVEYPCPNECSCFAEFGMTGWSSWQSCMFKQNFFLSYDNPLENCHIGDWMGDSAIKLEGSYTMEECKEAVIALDGPNGATMDNPCEDQCSCWAVSNMYDWYSWNGENYQACMFTGDVEQCDIGDGVGGQELELSGSYTVDECKKEVRKNHPNANGATMDNPCPGKCLCYAEFDMIGWKKNGQKFQSCMFED